MPFQRIELLPDAHRHASLELVARWESYQGQKAYNVIMRRIALGAGKNFLEYDFEDGKLAILEDDSDLRGFRVFSESFSFDADVDTFKYIDFSYSNWWHTEVCRGSFFQCRFRFARFYNTKFVNCVFALSSFYGCAFDKCIFQNCDFIDENGFINCDFRENSIFEMCFFNKNKLIDCRLEVSCEINGPNSPVYFCVLPKALQCLERIETLNIVDIIQGIRDAYQAGGALKRARHYAFLQSKAFTRFNSQRKFTGYFWEYLAGYGLRPERVLFWYLASLLLTYFWFWIGLKNAKEAALLAAGAILTFGAKSDLLEKLALIDIAIYITAAFVGISLLSLMITVVAAKVLGEV